MPDTQVVLGSITFADTEIPERIPFGCEQRLAIHELVGGARVIDAMGRTNKPIDWAGLLRGQDATARAYEIEALVNGAQQSLNWGSLAFSVIVRSFDADYQRFYQIPYRISCEVLSDLSNPESTAQPASVDDQINADAASAQDLAGSIDDPPLTTLMNALATAMSLVPVFLGAAPSIINGVRQAVQNAQVRVVTLIDSNDPSLDGAFGGIAPNMPPVLAVAAFQAQLATTQTVLDLYNLRAVLGRMDANLLCVNSSPNIVFLAGGNLFQLAETYYDDATAWTAIAKANGLTDPFIQGAQKLLIPPQPDNSGGILSS